MLQANPHNEDGRPMFIHTNIHKLSVAAIANDNTPFGASLRGGHRAIRPKELVDDMNIDPEPSLWQVLQHTACWSRAFGNRTTCMKLRKHRSSTFNASLPPHRAESQPRSICGIGGAKLGKQHIIGTDSRHGQQHLSRRYLISE